MKVYDLFPFFNELPLLELRLAELGPIVDLFGLVELPVTFTDKPKRLYFTEEGPHRSDIRFYVPAAYPSGVHPTVDWFQRAQLGKLIYDSDPDDIIMVSDVDEIPNREVVKQVIAAKYDHPVVLQMKLYYHRADLFDPSGPWCGTIIAPRHCLGEDFDAQELRHLRNSLPQIPDGGWHFSWLGNGEAIKEKLQAVDIERDSYDAMKHPSEDREFLQSCYEKGVDLFGRREHNKVRVPIIPGVNQPHEIAAWLEKYPQYAAIDAVAY